MALLCPCPWPHTTDLRAVNIRIKAGNLVVWVVLQELGVHQRQKVRTPCIFCILPRMSDATELPRSWLIQTTGTSHVPCKFFPYGTCQAGAACQFSHDLDVTTQNAPCKYFAKGSCKFGQSCALAHILPDGRAINRPPRGSQAAYGRRGMQSSHLTSGPPSSLLSMQANDPLAMNGGQYQQYQHQDMSNSTFTTQPSSPMMRPEGYGAAYGSPHGLGRLASSPPQPGLSVLDAPLPGSFDSQGISHAARHGPLASSVPPRFGIESPPSSLPNKTLMGHTALRDLRESAYGDTANLDGVLHGLGSSPPAFNESLTFTKRPLHSERFARPKMLVSTSWDVRPTHFNMDASGSDDNSSDDGIGEDLLPSSLHELLPQEKLRRFSRPTMEEDNSSLPLASAQRRAISNGHTPQDSKVGSVSPHSASPSRYSSIWSSRPINKAEENTAFPSSFGHVGSPLRPSNLRTSSLNFSTPTGGTFNSAVGSPPTTGGMSMLTRELQKTKLQENVKPPQSMHPGMTRNLSSQLGRDKIDEEQGLFSMEEEDAGEKTMGTV